MPGSFICYSLPRSLLTHNGCPVRSSPIPTLIASLLLCAPLKADPVEIEDKQGRAFHATIVEADDQAVQVQKPGEAKIYTINRDDLSIETNDLINMFIQDKEAEALEEPGYSSVTVTDAFKVTLELFVKLPSKDLRLSGRAQGNAYCNGGSGANHLSLHLSSRNLDKVEQNANSIKRNKIDQANSKQERERLAREINVRAIHWGKWRGFMVDGLQGKSQCWVQDGQYRVAVAVYHSGEGEFDKRSMEEIVQGMVIKPGK